MLHSHFFIAFSPTGERAHERMHVLSVRPISYKRRRDTKLDTCPVPCSLVVYIFLVILFSFVILTSVTGARAIFFPFSFL